jgi:DNA-directed RNA polymerase specialized sigma24 family protein
MELPYREVAQRLGCSEAAARVRVARGLSRLADMLEVS